MFPYQNPYQNSNYFSNYPMQQTQYNAPQPAGIPGRTLADFSEITIKDIPTDGSWAYFVKADGSEIQSRRWSENGQVVTATFTRQQTQPAADPVADRFQAIEARLEKIEKQQETKDEQ